MVNISTDNTIIYSILEKANALPVRFDLDNVLAFDQEDDFYVIIYLSDSRNFICFSISDYLQDSNKFIYMQQVVESSEKGIPFGLIEEALQLIENKMLTKNNNSYYFDAH